jgi:L-rhamnose isomerase
MNMNAYTLAKERYAALGVDTEGVLNTLKDVTVSVHCWQGDDVVGFDAKEALSGGIQTTGNYPGKATTPEQLMADFDEVLRLTPGKKKLNLHASYAIFEDGEFADRDAIQPKYFSRWVAYAKERGLGIDFNPTFFSHSMVKDGLTLSSPDETVRKFWVEHGKRCMEIAEYFAEETGKPCVINFWIPDGYKDYPADRLSPRRRYAQSMDEILSVPYDKTKVFPCIESKVFGIGLEAYTVGSAEFCTNYVNTRRITPLMDNGHYHPTELVSDKISSMLLFNDRLALHITRPMRWDSDHVVLFDDETREMMKEIVRADALGRVFLATDYFDASINRISAWVTGLHSVQKALLFALLEPKTLKALQDANNFTELMVRQEELKTMPFGAVWEEYLRRETVPQDYFAEIKRYEADVLSKR